MVSSASSRAAAVYGVGFSFLVMLLSGLMLTVAPRGATANAIDWQLLGLTRGGWEAVHLSTALVFSVFALWHIVLHWPVIVNFTFGTSLHPHGHRIEALTVMLIVTALLITAILDLPPSSWLVDLNGYFKREFWEVAR